MTAVSCAFCNAQQMEAPECLDPQTLAGCLPACAESSGLLSLVAAHSSEQEKPRCPVTYLLGSEFCFLGQDLEDSFQVGVSFLAADLGSQSRQPCPCLHSWSQMWAPPYSSSRKREIDVKGKALPFRQVTQNLLLAFPHNQLFRIASGESGQPCAQEGERPDQSAINTTSSYHCLFQKAPLPAVHIVYYLLFTDKLQLDHILINDLLWPSYLQIFFLWFQIIRWLGIAVELLIHRFQKICLQCIGNNRCRIRSQSTSV